MDAIFRYGSGLNRCIECGNYTPDYDTVMVDGAAYCQDCGTHIQAEQFAGAINALIEFLEPGVPQSQRRFESLFKLNPYKIT